MFTLFGSLKIMTYVAFGKSTPLQFSSIVELEDNFAKSRNWLIICLQLANCKCLISMYDRKSELGGGFFFGDPVILHFS